MKRLWLLLILILVVSACSGMKENRLDSVEELFNRGLSYYENEKYLKARETFQKLKDNYPLSKYSIVAELRIADANYYDKEYSEAIFYYEEFRKLHPTNPVIPYVLYQIGMCYFQQTLSIDRSQVFTKNAAKHFEYLISRHPSSSYAASGREKLMICNEKLAQHEFYVGRFYFKGNKYKAALYRFTEIIERFPGSPLKDKAYFYVGRSYLSLEENEKAKSAFNHLVKNYPNSEYYNEAKGLLKKLK